MLRYQVQFDLKAFLRAPSVARRENSLGNLRDLIHDLTFFVLCCVSPEVGVRRETFARHEVVEPRGDSRWSMVPRLDPPGALMLRAQRSLDLVQQGVVLEGERIYLGSRLQFHGMTVR